MPIAPGISLSDLTGETDPNSWLAAQGTPAFLTQAPPPVAPVLRVPQEPPPVTDMSTRAAPSVVPVVPPAGGRFALTKSPQLGPMIPGINPVFGKATTYGAASTDPTTGMPSAM